MFLGLTWVSASDPELLCPTQRTTEKAVAFMPSRALQIAPIQMAVPSQPIGRGRGVSSLGHMSIHAHALSLICRRALIFQTHPCFTVMQLAVELISGQVRIKQLPKLKDALDQAHPQPWSRIRAITQEPNPILKSVHASVHVPSRLIAMQNMPSMASAST